MKKLILSLGLLALVSYSSQAQEKRAEEKPKAVKPQPEAPKNHTVPNPAPQSGAVQTPVAASDAAPQSLADIKFEKLVHDYGTIKQGGDGNCEFKFTNTGKEPLILSNCQGSCGCTVPNCPKEPILPGKTGVIKVHYDTKRVGPINKSVSVQSNAKSGMMTLQIKGTVEAAPAEEPFPANKPNVGPVEKN